MPRSLAGPAAGAVPKGMLRDPLRESPFGEDVPMGCCAMLCEVHPLGSSLDPFSQRAGHALQNRGKIILIQVDIQDAKAFPVVAGGG
jgi:hypothetical protein